MVPEVGAERRRGEVDGWGWKVRSSVEEEEVEWEGGMEGG